MVTVDVVDVVVVVGLTVDVVDVVVTVDVVDVVVGLTVDVVVVVVVVEVTVPHLPKAAWHPEPHQASPVPQNPHREQH